MRWRGAYSDRLAGMRAIVPPDAPCADCCNIPCGQGLLIVPVIPQSARQSGRRKPVARKVPPITLPVLPTGWPFDWRGKSKPALNPKRITLNRLRRVDIFCPDVETKNVAGKSKLWLLLTCLNRSRFQSGGSDRRPCRANRSGAFIFLQATRQASPLSTG